ncbi:hypothetical protein IWW50_006854, partial [Coemansia erecta]
MSIPQNSHGDDANEVFHEPATLHVSTAQTAETDDLPEPRIRIELPAMFDGQTANFTAFRDAFYVFFDMYPRMTDEKHRQLVVNRFTGAARAWYTALVKTEEQPETSDELWEMLALEFGDPFEHENAYAELINLRQTSASCASHNLRFTELLGNSGRGDSAEVQIMYINSLRPALAARLRAERDIGTLALLKQRARILEPLDRPVATTNFGRNQSAMVSTTQTGRSSTNGR